MGSCTENKSIDADPMINVGIPAKGIPEITPVVLLNERHSHLLSKPDEAHRLIREFVAE